MTRHPTRSLSEASNISDFTHVSEMEFDDDMDVESGIHTPAEIVYSEKKLAFRPKNGHIRDEFRLELHPLPERDGVIVSVIPPRKPKSEINHVPCDIVLVIDVSGSMGCEAPVPAASPSERERNGLSVLDLVKHAARTIIETLDENDRLGVVTFSTVAKVVQQLLPMTPKNKKDAWARVEKLEVESMTNLWHGILKGIKLFDDDQRSNSAAAIMILTDGMPNHMCPHQGYVPKIRSYNLPASLHTFGFGYSLKSGLLKSIAEIGSGNYAFIPDAGLIGTVFVHAVANLQSTFATSATLTITTSGNLTLAETMGDYAKLEEPKKSEPNVIYHKQLSIPLGNLQYGQSRDIFLKYDIQETIEPISTILATLDCTSLDSSPTDLFIERSINSITDIPKEILQYHRTRANICSVLSALFPLNVVGEHYLHLTSNLDQQRQDLEALIFVTKSLNLTDEFNASLLEDLCGPDPSGQIRLALSSQEYFSRWGKHYLLSLLNAHQKQICNSFKDPGPLMYGRESPLFIKCRDALDYAFDHLPPPQPTNVVKDKEGNVVTKKVEIRQYNRRRNPCFAAKCLVEMANGRKSAIAQLRKGMKVWTPRGDKVVSAVIATQVADYEMCKIGELLITDWHPILTNGRWAFPNEVAEEHETYTGSLHSVLLEPDEDPDAHSIRVGGHLAVTLGHGIITRTEESVDARAHIFLGDYQKVQKSLEALKIGRDGLHVSVGMERCSMTGLARGFIPTKNIAEEQGIQVVALERGTQLVSVVA